jgi:hypothetical protein
MRAYECGHQLISPLSICTEVVTGSERRARHFSVRVRSRRLNFRVKVQVDWTSEECVYNNVVSI